MSTATKVFTRKEILQLAEAIRGKRECQGMSSYDVVDAFGPKDAATMPTLIRLLKDPNPFVRMSACDLLAKIGPKADSVLSTLLCVLSHDVERGVRYRAACAVEQFGQAARSALPIIERATTDPEIEVRLVAAAIVAQLDRDNPHGIPVLTRALDSAEGFERWTAVRQLQHVGARSRAVLNALERRLVAHDENEVIRADVTRALNTLGR